MPGKPDPVLAEALDAAFRRADADLCAWLPNAAAQIRERLHGVPTRPEHAFGSRAFPHLLLPYWLSPAEERARDVDFHADLLYSSILGYYAIRLCDNIADNEGSAELHKLTPCTLYFDSRATRIYMKHFASDHPFWPLFDRFTSQQADASAGDSFLCDVDASTFASLSAKKFTGAKIPISAALLRYRGSEAALESWFGFVDCLGDFAQFSNDFFDWRRDKVHGIVTYLSSQAKRQAPGDDLTTWMLGPGFDWGAAELNARFDKVRVLADDLGNTEVRDWTLSRGRVLEADIEALGSGLELIRKFGRIISSQDP